MNRKTKESSMSVKENIGILGLNQTSRAELRRRNPRASHVVGKNKKGRVEFEKPDFYHLANHDLGMNNINRNDFAAIIRQRRLSRWLTLRVLADASGVSASHLARIERRERFPSAIILRKIAKPLGLAEEELFVLAGYLSGAVPTKANSNGLDPYVAKVLAREPVETQRSVIEILTTVKSLAKSTTKE